MKLTYIQFAKDYNFEEAWKLDLPLNVVDDEIVAYINQGKYLNICCEIFFETENGYLIIGFSSINNEYLKFIKDSLSFSQNDNNINEYISNAKNKIPDLVRIGILDYWFKTGLCTLWSKGNQKDFSRENIIKLLNTTPQLLQTNLNPQGISFYFSKTDINPEHWIMYDVSKKEGKVYNINIERIIELLNTYK